MGGKALFPSPDTTCHHDCEYAGREITVFVCGILSPVNPFLSGFLNTHSEYSVTSKIFLQVVLSKKMNDKGYDECETQTLDKKVPCRAYFLRNKSSPPKTIFGKRKRQNFGAVNPHI